MSDPAPAEPGVWHHFRRTWRTLFTIQALALVLGAVVAGPVLAFAMRAALATSRHAALSDADIVTFFTRPLGLLLGLTLACLWLTLQLLGYGTQLVAAHRSFHGHTSTATGSLARVASRLPGLLLLAVHYLVQFIGIALPFVAAILVVLYVQLGERDINYYLATRPPDFILAIILTVLLLGIMAYFLIRLTVGWIHAMPLLLFGGKKPTEARRLSQRHTNGQRRHVFLALTLWAVGTPLLVALVNLPWPPLILWIAELLQHRLGLLALALSLLLAISGGLGLLVGFTTQSLLAVATLKWFRQAGLDPDTPPRDAVHLTRRLPWKILAGASVPALALSTLYFHTEMSDLRTEDDAVVIAHRGASDEAPENSLAAVRQAIERGADWIEIDVQETADGRVLVFHDRDFMRLAGEKLRLRDASPEQLAELDIGSWFAPRFAGERVPTLGEVLDLCRGRAGVMIELKYYGGEERLEERVIDLVEARDMAGEVMIMSLEAGALERFRELRPKWPVGLLATLSMGDLTRLDVDFLALNERAAGDALIERAHAADMKVFVWTVNDPPVMSALLNRGVDGLITDRPRVCRRVIEERESLNAGERVLIDIAGRLDQLPETVTP